MNPRELEDQIVAAHEAGDFQTAKRLGAQLAELAQQPSESSVLSAEDLIVQAHEAGDFETAQKIADQLEAQKRASGPQGSFLDPLIEGATLGFRDELAGVTGVLDGLASGLSYKEAQKQYEMFKTHSAARGAQYKAENPNLSTGLEIAGGALMGGGGLVRSGARAAGKRALAGGAIGAVSGIGHAEDPGLSDAAFGAAGGAVLGAAGPALTSAAGRGVKALATRFSGGDVTAAAQAGAQALEQGAARQLGLWGNKGLSEGKKAIRETLKALTPKERQAFQRSMLGKAEELIRGGKLNPVQMRGLKSTLRTGMGGGAGARKVLRGVDKLAKGGGKVTDKAAIAAKMAEIGLKVAGRYSGTARALGSVAGKAHQKLANAPGLALPPTPAPQLPPQMQAALMGLSAPQAALMLPQGQVMP